MNKNNLGKVALNSKIFDMLISNDEFYRDVLSIKRLSLPNFPKYDQWCEDNFFNIEFALAGYSINDISVFSKSNENSIYIEGRKDKDVSSTGVIVRGIAKRNFKTGFMIDRLYNTKKAKIFLKDGILKIQIPKINENISEIINLEVNNGKD